MERLFRVGAVLIGVTLIILIIVAIVGTVRRGSAGRGPDVLETPLLERDRSTLTVEMRNDGVVNSEDEHRAIRIIVNEDQVQYRVIKGYGDQIIDRRDFDNTEESFDAFLTALVGYGFDLARGVDRDVVGEFSVCAQGERYVFIVREDGEETQRTWATSCTVKQGTSASIRSDVERLFKGQIPDYRNLSREVELR